MKAVNPETKRADNVQAARGTVRLLKKINPLPGEIFLDIGANVGYVSNCMAELGLWVYSCGLFRLCKRDALTIQANVTRYEKAVTSDGRNIDMHIRTEAMERGYLCSAKAVKRPDSSFTKFGNIESVPVQEAIDAVKPDIIKIDIEGGEWEILPVADLSCARALFIEFHGHNSMKWPEAIKRLHHQGFAPVFGWPKNARWEEGAIKGAGFWIELLFEKKNVSLDSINGLAELLKGPGPEQTVKK